MILTMPCLRAAASTSADPGRALSFGMRAHMCRHLLQGFEGKRGLTITPSQSSNTSACMAQSAIGNSNHFGYTSRKGSCLSVESGAALASESFSCVCLFSSTNSAVAAGAVSSSSLG